MFSLCEVIFRCSGILHRYFISIQIIKMYQQSKSFFSTLARFRTPLREDPLLDICTGVSHFFCLAGHVAIILFVLYGVSATFAGTMH